MRVRSLREHYRRKNGNWIPKVRYSSQYQAVNRLGKSGHNTTYKLYTCNVCNGIHATDLTKRNKR